MPDGCTQSIRANQVEEAIEFVKQWAPQDDASRDTLLMGDLNIRHQNEDGTVTTEYAKRMADFAGIGLTDVWSETSPKDPVSSMAGTHNDKLDYILHRPPASTSDTSFAFCTQHETLERHFVYHEDTDGGPVAIDASDHLPYAALIGHAAPLCSPATAETAPPDGTTTRTIKHPGAYQWLHFTEGGTYGFGVQGPVRMEMTAYPEDDLSTPMKPFLGQGVIPGGTETPESVVWAPAHGFYLRVRAVDGADPYWTGTYQLKINKHDGTSPAEAIQLDPFGWYTGQQMSAAALPSPAPAAWFWVQTETLDSGQQQRLRFETTRHPGLWLQTTLFDKATFDAGQQVGLVNSNWGSPSTVLASPQPNDPDQFSPIPPKGALYYLRVRRTTNSVGQFAVRWTTNLFHVQLSRLQVNDEEDETGDDEPEPIVTIDGYQHVAPLGEMDEDGPPHAFPSELQMIRAAKEVGVHVYENDVDDAGGCLQAPTECADMGYASVSPFNTTDTSSPLYKPNYVNVDLDPVEHTFFPWFTNVDDYDGDYTAWYSAWWRIDQGG